MISKSLEEYLKTIYIIQKQENVPRVTDIAIKMNCTKASVNKSLKLLKEERLINYEPYGKIDLTEEGLKLAKKILEANDIVYLFLTAILGETPEVAEKEAKDMKMVMKDSSINKLARYVHKELGLYSLDCGYDINNEHCIECERRKKVEI